MVAGLLTISRYQAMCYCGYGYPSAYYTPLNYYGYAPYPAYPAYSYSLPSYGLPIGYVYSGAYSPMPYAALGYPRGEYRVGNCLMVC